MKELIDSLPASQKCAIEVLKVFIDIYNTSEGTGLFAGLARYSYLETRCKIAAVQNKEIMSFWSSLRQKLNCPISSKKDDEKIIRLWGFDNQIQVIKELATKSAECIMLARLLHDEDKEERRRANKEKKDLLDLSDLNDNVGDFT